MKEFVQLSLGTYDALKYNNSYLAKELNKEKTRHDEDVAELQDKITELTCQIESFKNELLEAYKDTYDLEHCDLLHCLDLKSALCGLLQCDYLLKIGFTEEELKDYITKEWNKYHRKESENGNQEWRKN